jgi:hypothetical protein
MEALLIGAAAQYLVPLIGAVIAGAAAYGVKLLKGKIKIEEGKQALDALDGIIQTTVGNIAQTTAKEMKQTVKKAHLSASQGKTLKTQAIADIKTIASAELKKAAATAVVDLEGYIGRKIEDTVLKLKK